MSDLLHAMRGCEPFTCPVSQGATAWWMSATRCAENLAHAAIMDVSGADPACAWLLPVLRMSIGEVIATCAAIYGDDRKGLVTFEPNEKLEAVFGR